MGGTGNIHPRGVGVVIATNIPKQSPGTGGGPFKFNGTRPFHISRRNRTGNRAFVAQVDSSVHAFELNIYCGSFSGRSHRKQMNQHKQ